MILDVADEHKTPHLSKTDRMILFLFELGICTREQLEVITGWSTNQINGAIRRIRATADNPDEWVTSWRPRQNKPAVYALGSEGMAYARELRGEFSEDARRKRPPRGQVHHFVGTNQILVRLIRSGLNVQEWMSGKGVSVWLYNELLTRVEPGKPEPKNSPYRPDALVRVNGVSFLVEYDTASEPSPRLMERFSRAFDLSVMMPLPPILFVTVSERRCEEAARALERAIERYPERDILGSRIPDILFCTEGTEVDFLRTYLETCGTPLRLVR